MKKKIANIVLVVVFAAALVVPLCFADFQGGQMSAAENRLLQTFPQGKDLYSPSNIEAWINDNIGGRTLASRALTRANYSLWGVSQKQDDFFGKEGWLYYAPASVRADFIGTNLQTGESVSTLGDSFVPVKDYVESKGAVFQSFLFPDKKTAYPEYYMPGIERIVPETRSELLARYIREHTDVDFFYLKDDMMAEKVRGQLYSQHLDDAHWNGLGAYVGYRFIAGKVQERFPETLLPGEDEVQILETVGENLFFDAIPFKEPTYLVLLGHEEDMREEPEFMEQFEGLTFLDVPQWYKKHVVNLAAPEAPKVLYIGDSYSIMLLPLLTQSFGETTFLHIGEMSAHIDEMMETLQPDIVILAVVERMLDDFYKQQLSTFHLGT